MVREHIYLFIFLFLFMIRNGLEINRVLRFHFKMPEKGKVTMLTSTFIYTISSIICLIDLYNNKISSIFVFIIGILLYSVFFISREIASWQMGKSYSNQISTPEEKMVESGIYKKIRHPLYLFYGLEILGLFICCFNFIIVFLFLIFFTLIIIRINYEEKYLVKKFGGQYIQYQTRTKKLIPFIY